MTRRPQDRTGSNNPNPRNNGSAKGPLRAITEVIRAASDVWDRPLVVLECGHRTTATRGATRARCPQCKREA
jgi:predicted Zn-ribbon and HTH transcriptional regulator